jgi:methyl farnesoate epoxidase/farnesoate epoxidase
MEEKIQEETRDLISMFKKQCSEPIWMHTAFDVSVLNVLWAMMAGERFNIDDERLRKLLNIIHDAFRLTDMSGGILNQMPFLRFIAPETCGYNQLVNVLVRMWEFLEVLLDLFTFCQKLCNCLRKLFLNTEEPCVPPMPEI